MEQRKYYNEFQKYMKTVHNIELEDYNGYIYVVHLQGCEDCINSSLRLLNSIDPKHRNKITLITVGNQPDNNHFFKNIPDKEYNIVTDRMQNIFNYQTNFAYPLFVQIRNV